LADQARIDLQMTAITGADANSVYIVVHLLQKLTDTIRLRRAVLEAKIDGDGHGEPAHLLGFDVFVGTRWARRRK
jgi:hypothetical protein